jgi:hypothetical protein
MTSAEYAPGLLARGLRLVRARREDGSMTPEFLTNVGTFGSDEDREHRGVNAGALLLAAASILLAANAAAMGVVSWHAQYAFVFHVKHQHVASGLEALGLDAGAVIFAILGIALAILGRRAGIERALVVACSAGSAGMNLLGANLGSPRSVAVYVMPSLLFAAGSDRLIAVIRRAAMGKREDEGAQRSAWRVAGLVVLYLARFTVAAPSTWTGSRQALLNATPLPGLPAPAAPLAIEPPEVMVECPLCLQQVAVSEGRMAAHECAERPEGDRRWEREHRAPRAGTKTGRFLDLVRARYGDLADVDPEKVSRICSELAPEVELDAGSARRELRAAVLAAQAGGTR